MDIKKIVNNTCKVAFSLILGGAILYWMYRGFDFKTGGARAVSQDELDLDATVVPLRHPGPALSWLAMEADSRTR